MGEVFEAAKPKTFLRQGRTYPGVFPILHLDHFYYEKHLVLRSFRVHRTAGHWLHPIIYRLWLNSNWPIPQVKGLDFHGLEQMAADRADIQRQRCKSLQQNPPKKTIVAGEQIP